MTDNMLCARLRGLTSRQTSKRPIIFVAHSLGSIIMKSVSEIVKSTSTLKQQIKALIYSDAARRGALEEHHAMKLSSYGIIFMDTTHQGGSGVALSRLMVNVASVFVAANSGLLLHLERDSEWLSYCMLRSYRSLFCSVHCV